MSSPSIGKIVGFSLLGLSAVAFAVGILIYVLYLHICKKEPSDDANKKIKRKRDSNDNDTNRVSLASSKQNGYRNSGISDRVSDNRASSARSEDSHQHVVAISEADIEGSENPVAALENVLDEEDKRTEEASQLGSEYRTTDSGFATGTLERAQPEILDDDPDYKRNSELYARVDDVIVVENKLASSNSFRAVVQEPSQESTVATDTLERREAKDLGRSNSILNRLKYFESAENNSLVRPAKKNNDELDGLRVKVVSNLVTDFEKSETVLFGRQAPEAGSEIQQMPKKIHSEEPGSDPVYAVPDRSRRSTKSTRSRLDSQGSGKSQEGASPPVPEKHD